MKRRNQSKISSKRIKLQEIVEGEVDRISALPDCLLVEILSRLPSTKDAIRTGTLSKGWKYVWTSAHTLVFTDRNQPVSDVVFFVDKTLTQCRQLKLKKLELVTWYDIRYELQVNNWIRYAISCNLEELNLEFWYRYWGLKALFLLDQSIFISSSFTNLRLAGCVLDPTGAINWKKLRRLCISDGDLDEDLIENILTGSPVLETLVLDHCYGYRVLNITSKSIKKLVFSGYMHPDEDGTAVIQINAPNNSSLTIEYDLFLRELLLLNVSSLVDANLDYAHMGLMELETPPEEAEEEMLKRLILNLRHCKELKIGVDFSTVLLGLQAKGFIVPPNVKFPDVTHG